MASYRALKGLRMTTSADFREFKVDIPREKVERLKRKLNDTRLPGREIVPDAGTLYGPSYAWALELLEEWRHNFDWYKAQGQINEYPHYLCSIEGLDIHFLHACAENPNAIPLLLVQGWPGSFLRYAWVQLVRLATETRVDSSRQCPCFQQANKQAGLLRIYGSRRRLDHFVARELGARYTDSCKLVHFNFAPAGLPDEREGRTVEDQNLAVRADDFLKNHLGYAVCMRTRYEAANPENQKHASWKEAILTTASLYYFTDCIMPSALCYYENVRHEHFAEFTQDPVNRVQVPFGYSSFHWDVDFSSKRAVEKTGNLVFYREHKNGGHFAALECPLEIVQDLRELASQEWKS
ncbi:Alpha/Beta hydrolase protein [Aspergillus pseudodeflectus]|uniref:Alpha/Beta hydrolase protein n=1 Tax=Aspergillus pseudodeflectus TaxID=176178 RepID=A0ABR4KF97_9EURO